MSLMVILMRPLVHMMRVLRVKLMWTFLPIMFRRNFVILEYLWCRNFRVELVSRCYICRGFPPTNLSLRFAIVAVIVKIKLVHGWDCRRALRCVFVESVFSFVLEGFLPTK